MKILCVIDHFGSGGAQRQMVELACGLITLKHEIEIFSYYPRYDFFRSRLDDAGITIHQCNSDIPKPIDIIQRLSSLQSINSYDIVLSYLNNPNLYSELVKLLGAKYLLVVSERASHYSDVSKIDSFVRRNAHRIADHVVTNSFTQAEWLNNNFPFLSHKISTIYNGINISDFKVAALTPKHKKDLKLLAIGRVDVGKNGLNLLKALKLFNKKFGWIPSVSWAGRRDVTEKGSKYADNLEYEIKKSSEVKERWNWLGERNDVAELLRSHHALVHPSLYEGLPNAICEALAAGRPVLASNVCDHSYLVEEGVWGFLFDPLRPESICDAIEKLSLSSKMEWENMHDKAVFYAQTQLSVPKLVVEYENLFFKLMSN